MKTKPAPSNPKALNTKNSQKPSPWAQRKESAVQKTPPPAQKAIKSEIVYGLHAGLAVFQRRPEQIFRIAYAHEHKKILGDLIHFAFEKRIPCIESELNTIDQLANTKNHEGLYLEVQARSFATPAELCSAMQKGRGLAIALDRVRNPYNIGAILRSAAFFGIDALLLGAPAPHPALPADALRVAEGGAEHLLLSRTTDLADTLSRLKSQGICIAGADARASSSVNTFKFKKPMLVVVGHEREGLSDRVRGQCDVFISIEGSGAVESLNVAVAAGIFMAQMAGQIPAPAQKREKAG